MSSHEEAHLSAVSSPVSPAETLLRERTEEIEALFNVSPVGIFVAHDPQCLRITGNPAGYALVEEPYQPGVNISATAPEGYRPSYSLFREGVPVAPEQLPMQIAAREGIEVLEELLEARFANGKRKLLYIYARPLFDQNGQTRGAISAVVDITSHQEAEAALRESQERLLIAFEAAHMGAWDWDLVSGKMQWNAQFFQLLGLEPSEEAQNVHDFLPFIYEDDQGAVRSRLQNSFRENGIFEADFRVRRADTGAIRWMSAYGRVVETREGAAVRMGGVMSDVTQRKAAEHALRHSEERLKRAMRIGSVGVLFFDAQGHITDCNETFLEMVGFKAKNLFADTVKWLDLTPPDWREQAENATRELCEQGRSTPHETQVLRADGTRFWALRAASKINDNESVEYFLDISPSKAAQEQLRASEAHLQLVMESVTEHAIITTDAQARISGWNEGAARIFGYTPEQVLGQPVTILFTPEDRAAGVPEAEMQQALETGRATDERWHLRSDGSRFYLSGITSPLRDGEVKGFVKVARDLTEERHAAELLRQSEERYRIALEAAEMAAWDWDLKTNCVKWNEQHYSLMGLQPMPDDRKPEDFMNSLHPDDFERVSRALQRALNETGFYQEDFRIVRADNHETRWMTGYGRVVEEQKGRATRMSGVMFDSTQRKSTEEALETRVTERTRELAKTLEELRAQIVEREKAEAARDQLMRRIVSTQEAERRRISRELHDNLGQHLTAVMLGLQSLQNTLETPENRRDEIAPGLENLRVLVDGLMQAAHRQAWELRPAELDDMGLEVALRQFIADWSRRTEIEADFQAIAWNQRLDTEIETTLYRVVQEALTNVSRHARATHVSVILELNRSGASAIIEDDGDGFEPSELSDSGRLGLLGMSERLAIVGGNLNIESSPGQGTTIYARVPQRAEAV